MAGDSAAVVIAHILPLVVGAAVSPAVLGASVEILVAFGRRGRRMLLLYGLGALLVVVVALVVSAGLPERRRDAAGNELSDAVDLVIAAFLLLMAAFLWFHRPRPTKHSGFGRLLASRWAGPSVLVAGIAMMATNLSTLVLVLAGAHEVAAAGDIARLGGYAFLVVGALLPILVPLVWATVQPAAADRALRRLNTAIARHGRAMGIVVCLVAAAYLLARGLALI